MKIWDEIDEVNDVFDASKNVEFKDWAEAEGLNGLENIPEDSSTVQRMLEIARTESDPRVVVLFAFVAGVRTGKALSKEAS